MLARVRSWFGARPEATSLTVAGRLHELGAIFVGFSLVAAASAGIVASRTRRSLPTALEAEIFGLVASQVLLLGLLVILVYAVVFAARGSKRVSRAVLTALALGLCALSPAFLDEDLGGLAFRVSELAPVPFWLVQRTLTSAAALALLGVWALGWLLRRRLLRLVTLPLAGAVLWFHGTDLVYSYEGVHLAASLSAGLLVGSAWIGARVPRALTVPVAKRVMLLLALLGAVPAALVQPTQRGMAELSRQPLAVLTPFPIVRADRAYVVFELTPDEAPFYADRTSAGPVPPSDPPLMRAEVVLLVGVDSLRADVLEKEELRDQLPTLFSLRDEGFYFAQARSPGSSTGPAIAALFASRTYSQLYWVPHPKRPFEPFPHEDPSPRFPELLSGAEIPTVTIDSVGWLLNDFGIVRGFSEERTLREGKGYPLSKAVFDALVPRLRAHDRGPLFAFAHLLDAHSPYNSATQTGTPFERYLAELAVVDGQLARLIRELKHKRLWGRTTLIVYSDHGEAFGEHGSKFHGHGVYEELIRVPLIVRTPKPGRRIEAPVTLLDVGPTILDLYGLETPGSMMGLSLVPWMRDGSATPPPRPIVSEARLKRAIVFPDGSKVIHDTRHYTVEEYDLNADPGELSDRYDEGNRESVVRLSKLKRFFEVHALRRPGYKPPFRRW